MFTPWPHLSSPPHNRSTYLFLTTLDLGTCICDLTWDACDYNCYCDPDCTYTEKTLFTDGKDEGIFRVFVKA